MLFLQCATVLRKYAHWTLMPLSLWIMLFTYSLHSLSLSHTHTGIHVNTNTHAHTFSHSLLFHSVYYCMISQFFIQPYVLPSAKPDWHLVSNIEQQLFLQNHEIESYRNFSSEKSSKMSQSWLFLTSNVWSECLFTQLNFSLLFCQNYGISEEA